MADDPTHLIEKYLPIVTRVCRAHLSRPDQVDDAAQETFIQFLLADRERIANPEAWLVAVATRMCGHIHRWHYGHPEVDLVEDSARSDHLRELDDVLDTVWFERLVSHLPPLDRHVLTWLYLRQLPKDLLATDLGVSGDHLRVIAYRARCRALRAYRALDDGVGL